MATSDDPMGAVNQYIGAFNDGDAEAMATACADPIRSRRDVPARLARSDRRSRLVEGRAHRGRALRGVGLPHRPRRAPSC